MQTFRSMRNRLRCLCTVQRCTRASDHTRPSASPARRAVDDDQVRRRQTTRDQIVEQTAPRRLALAAMLRTASSTFCRSRRIPTPPAARSRSLAVQPNRTTVHPGSVGQHPLQQRAAAPCVPVVCTFRHVRLTVSSIPRLDNAPVPLIRRVLVPTVGAAITASTCFVMRA